MQHAGSQLKLHEVVAKTLLVFSEMSHRQVALCRDLRIVQNERQPEDVTVLAGGLP